MKSFSENISIIINIILLTATYIIGVGIGKIIAKNTRFEKGKWKKATRKKTKKLNNL